MHTLNRLVWSLALASIIARGVACGGGAEEPAENTPDANEPAAVSAPSPSPSFSLVEALSDFIFFAILGKISFALLRSFSAAAVSLPAYDIANAMIAKA